MAVVRLAASCAKRYHQVDLFGKTRKVKQETLREMPQRSLASGADMVVVVVVVVVVVAVAAGYEMEAVEAEERATDA